MLASFKDVLDLLEKQKVPHATNPEAQMVEMPTNSPPLAGSMVFKWEPQAPLVQFIVVLAVQVPSERMAAVENAIARINHALVLPGFGMNHANGALYFRIVVPRRPEGLSENDLEAGIRAAVQTSKEFFLPLKAVVVEGHDPADVLKAAMAAKAPPSGADA